MAQPFTVRISRNAAYCSGALIQDDLEDSTSGDTDLVLTCAHFFRDRSTPVKVTGTGVINRVADVETLPGTDIAVVRLRRILRNRAIPRVSDLRPGLLYRCRTEGYGGNSPTVRARTGRIIGFSPFAISRDLKTRVRHAAFVYSGDPAVRGDSGGPIIIDGTITAVQSLILDPGGIHLGMATVALTGPQINHIQQAVHQIRQRQHQQPH